MERTKINSANSVLLLGSLFHLPDRDERLNALPKPSTPSNTDSFQKAVFAPAY